MASLDNLTAIVAKLAADVDTKLAVITTQATRIAELEAQLAAFANDQTVIDAAVTSLTDADNKLIG